MSSRTQLVCQSVCSLVHVAAIIEYRLLHFLFPSVDTIGMNPVLGQIITYHDERVTKLRLTAVASPFANTHVTSPTAKLVSNCTVMNFWGNPGGQT